MSLDEPPRDPDRSPDPHRCLVAGVGNPLRGDDGFGPAVIRALEEGAPLPEGVVTVEVGIGGMGLVHELMAGYDALVVVDAVDRDAEPGTLFLLEPELPEPEPSAEEPARSVTADMHELVPERVFELAGALGILPRRVRIVGCQPARTEELTLELSAPVRRAVEEAAREVRRLVSGEHSEGPVRTAGERIRCRDEILQVLYWLHGEGLAREPHADDLRRFLADDLEGPLEAELEALTSSGLVEQAAPGRYRLTPAGRTEGARRFADAFRDMSGPGHGICDDPACDCHLEGPEACEHRPGPPSP